MLDGGNCLSSETTESWTLRTERSLMLLEEEIKRTETSLFTDHMVARTKCGMLFTLMSMTNGNQSKLLIQDSSKEDHSISFPEWTHTDFWPSLQMVDSLWLQEKTTVQINCSDMTLRTVPYWPTLEIMPSLSATTEEIEFWSQILTLKTGSRIGDSNKMVISQMNEEPA